MIPLLQLKHYMLPHDGVIPGARGHKKQVVPRGTKVWCIVYGTRVYWACYLNEAQASEVMANLQAGIDGRARRNISLDNMLKWNFGPSIPRRVVRPKE